MSDQRPGQSVIDSKGWIAAYKWLLLRRTSQLGILLLFMAGPWFGVWVVKGNLSSSLTLDVLPLTDPYLLVQSFIAGHVMEPVAITGAIIVLAFYWLIGGRVFCSWVCPVNMLTDAAAWLRRKLNIKGGAHFSRQLRYWLLAMTMVMAAVTGSIVWELVNPVSMFHRGVIFGMGLGWLILLAIFLFDALLSRHGWCGHLCPVGAFYSLVGTKSILRVSATRREQCDDCMDCYVVCPEQQVITPALKGADKGIGPVIMSANCTNCARCIDVCGKEVFTFTSRFHKQMSYQVTNHKEVTQ